MTNVFCVYIHTAPNGKKYVGITSKKPERRWQNGTGYKSNAHFFNAIKKYGWDNFAHEVVFEKLSSDAAKRIEQYLIQTFKSHEYAYGYNRSLGGESGFGVKHTAETRQKMSEAHTGEKNHFYGKKHSPETIAMLREASIGNQNWLGRKHSEETKAKISARRTGVPSPLKGKPLSPETCKNISNARIKFLERSDAVEIMRNANPNRKPVYQYSKDGTLVKIWESARQAEKELIPGGQLQAIRKCCSGDCNSAYGYIWSYKPLAEFPIIQRQRKVYQYDKMLNLIHVWDNLYNAVHNFRDKGKSTVISQCVSGHRPHAYGFIWSYSLLEREVI
jgi:group I intron endonuclease